MESRSTPETKLPACSSAQVHWESKHSPHHWKHALGMASPIEAITLNNSELQVSYP